jgi:hypothetical protein
MLIEIAVVLFVATYGAIAIYGHVLLIRAMLTKEDAATGAALSATEPAAVPPEPTTPAIDHQRAA